MAEDNIIKKIEQVPEKKVDDNQLFEDLKSPETALENKTEKVAELATTSQSSPVPQVPTTVSIPEPKTVLQIREEQIDKILSKGLDDMYLALPDDKKKEFRTAGEATVKKINEILNGTKIQIKKIVDLIKRWLSIIPGVNFLFLEQEAKIKADQIRQLKK